MVIFNTGYPVGVNLKGSGILKQIIEKIRKILRGLKIVIVLLISINKLTEIVCHIANIRLYEII